MKRISKALGALLGGATGVGVAAIASVVFGVELDPAVASALAVLFGAAGSFLAPKNAEPAAKQ